MGKISQSIIAVSVSAVVIAGSYTISNNVSALTVHDPANNSQLVKEFQQLKEQYKLMEEQYKTAIEAKNLAQDHINAVGKAGSITLPNLKSLNVGKFIENSLKCLAVDWRQIIPDIDMKNINLNSICEARDFYRNTMWIPGQDWFNMNNRERVSATQKIRKRRDDLLRQVITDNLSHGDVSTYENDNMIEAIKVIENNGRNAQTSNERLAVMLDALTLQLRATTETNKLLAQKLKLQATLALHAGIPVNDVLEEFEQDNNVANVNNGGANVN